MMTFESFLFLPEDASEVDLHNFIVVVVVRKKGATLRGWKQWLHGLL